VLNATYYTWSTDYEAFSLTKNFGHLKCAKKDGYILLVVFANR